MRIRISCNKRKCYVYLKVSSTFVLTIFLIKNILSIIDLVFYENFKPISNDGTQFFEIDPIQYNEFSLIYKSGTSEQKDVEINHNLCSLIPRGLNGRIQVRTKEISDKELDLKFEKIFNSTSGGHWKPSTCVSRSKVAIIVPYRDRKPQLNLFLNHMHSFLQKQLVEYSIYIIEEAPEIKFNRAKLMNIGFKEAMKDYSWDCLIFHDVDLLPENDRNLYLCSEQPRHMSIAVNTLGYRLPYEEIFGGVSAIRTDDFIRINGYSNSYYGWGGEDDDMFERLKMHGLALSRYSSDVGRYFMLTHKKDVPNKARDTLLETARERFAVDGLNNLKYNLNDRKYLRLYTWIFVGANDF